MVNEQDDLMDDVDKEERKEEREKVPVLVRRHEHTNKEEISVENDEDSKFEIPRSWFIY